MIPETPRLRYTSAYRLFSALAVVCLLLTALMMVDVILSPLEAQAYSGSVATRLLQGLLLAPLTALIGVLCVRYAPGNVVGLLLIFMAAGASLLSVRAAYDPLVVVLGGGIGAILFWACYLLLFLYFPNGQPYFRRAGALVARVTLLLFYGVAFAQILTAPTLRFGAYGADNSIANPFYTPGFEDAYALFTQVAGPIVPVFFLLFALVSFILRYRAARRSQRQQIKWLLWAFSIWLAPQMAVWLLPGLPAAVTEAVAAYGQGAAGFVAPLGIGAAILLNKLWDIDIIIRRTLIYGVLTALLAGVYFGGVVLLQALLRPLTGAGNDLAVVATTLLIAAIFFPLRQRVQGFIDRRFYRRKYDAAQVLAAFGQHVRDEVELEKLTGRLVAVVDETMRPAHVSLWLRPTAGTGKESLQ